MISKKNIFTKLLPRNAFDRSIGLWIGAFLLVLSLVLYFVNGTLTDDGAGFYFFLSIVAMVWGLKDRQIGTRILLSSYIPLLIAAFLPVSGHPILALMSLFLTLGVLFFALRIILTPRKSFVLFSSFEQPWWLIAVIIATIPFVLPDNMIWNILAAIVVLVLFVRTDALEKEKGLLRLFIVQFAFMVAVPIIVYANIITPIYNQLYIPKYIRDAVNLYSILLVIGSLLMLVRISSTPLIRTIRLKSQIRVKLLLTFIFSGVFPTIILLFLIAITGFFWFANYQERVCYNLLVNEPAKRLTQALRQSEIEFTSSEDTVTVRKDDSNNRLKFARYTLKKTLTKTKQTRFNLQLQEGSAGFRSVVLNDSITSPYTGFAFDGTHYFYIAMVEREGSWYAAIRQVNQHDLEWCKQQINADITITDVSYFVSDQVHASKFDKISDTLSTGDPDTSSAFLQHRFPIKFMSVNVLRFDKQRQESTIVIIFYTLESFIKTMTYGVGVIAQTTHVIQILVSIFLLLVILVAVNIGLQISRLLSESADRLITGTIALRRGELEHRIPVESKDEFGEIAYSFNLMAIDISRMMVEIREKERIQRDLDIARTIQIGLLPSEPPRINGWEIAARSDFAQDVGGDFYDFIPMEHHRLVITLGDVSGKGIPAAMLMANVQATMRALCSMYDDPRMIVTRLNEELVRTTAAELFVTLFLALLDCQTGEMQYVNAGHDNPFLWQSGKLHELTEGGTVIGAFSGMEYSIGKVQMASGDRLLVFSDGITEAGVETDEVFGNDRLRETFLAAVDKPATDELTNLFEKVNSFVAGAPPADDRTVICLRKR